MKAKIITGRKIFLALTAVILTGVFAPRTVNAQDWFDGQWMYRQPLAVTGTGTELTDFQMKVVLNTGNFTFGHAQSDGRDLRFTDSDGTALLPYWVEEWISATSAVIWVRIPNIPAGGKEIYIYYGNPTATGESNGTATFRFFDDFNNPASGNWVRRLLYSAGNWGPGYVEHDWKYSSEMQQGSLYFAMERAKPHVPAWEVASLDPEIEDEFDYIHSQISATGTVISDAGGFLAAEPQYCYGIIMSNLALGYLHFEISNPTLSERCYTDLIRVFDRLYTTYPTVANLNDAGGYGMLLHGFSNAWKAFTDHQADHGDAATRVTNALARVQGFANTFVANQPGGAWTGATAIQEHLKRNFGVIKAFDVTGNTAYLDAVADNIDYIMATYWIPATGGLEWYANHATSDHFYECHQQWFMIAVRMLYDASGGTYDYTAEGLQAWHFLTDNNYAFIDMYVHNYMNHAAFFGYRQITSGGTIQVDQWKGSYEIGTALWGMALNYEWVSDYQSSFSPQVYNYLGEMVDQIKNPPSEQGYFNQAGFVLNNSLWTLAGSPAVSIYNDNGNPVASFLGYGGANGHLYYIQSTYNTFDNAVLEMKVNLTVDLNNNCTPEVGFRVVNDQNRYITMLRGEGVVGGGGPNGDLFIRRYQANVQTNPTPYPPYNYTANHYYKYKIATSGTVITQYLDDVLIRTLDDAGSTITSGRISLGNYGGTPTNPVYYDDVRIRAYAATEPVAVPGPEEGDGKVWTGAGINGYWNQPENWNPAGIPSATDNVIIPATATAPWVRRVPVAVCYDLTIRPGASLMLSPAGDLTVNGDFVNNGIFTINSTGVSNGGSLIVHGTSQGNITYNRYLRPDDVPEETDEDRHFISSPVGGLTIEAFTNANGSRIELIGSDYKIRTFTETTAAWPLVTSGTFESGRGYTIGQAAGSTGLMAFTGTVVNTATFTATSPYKTGYTPRLTAHDYGTGNSEDIWSGDRNLNNYGGGGWNLMGNPFTSAMNAGAFISANSGKFDPHYQALYVYDGINNRYNWVATAIPDYPLEGEINTGEVQAGQGFFVLALYDNSVFNFNSSMQAHGAETLTLLKSASTENPWPGMRLKATYSSGKESVTTIVYNSDMTTGNDPGYDIGQMSTGPDVEIYTALVSKDNSINFARQALPVDGADKTVIPVGIDSEVGGEVTFSAATVPPGNCRFWLEDRNKGIFTDIGTKSYTVAIPPKTYGTGRFFILALTNTPTGIEKPETEDAGLRVWISFGKVVIKGDVSNNAICEVYNLQGQKIMETQLDGGELNTVSLPSGSRGYFVVKVVDGVDITTKKVTLL